jgi:hypothetical protein
VRPQFMNQSATLGEPEPGLLCNGGTAAWAKTQQTPGVSTLAAPHHKVYSLWQRTKGE